MDEWMDGWMDGDCVIGGWGEIKYWGTDDTMTTTIVPTPQLRGKVRYRDTERTRKLIT
jgi:hypothetical protein